MVSEVAKAKAAMLAKKKTEAPPWTNGLSTGSTMLNLALTGNPDLGLCRNSYYLLVGDSQAGKSWLAMTILAEASINKAYKDYRLIHDNPERGTLMNTKRYFGNELAKRLEPPTKNGASNTLEEFYDNVAENIRQGPCIYVLDSEDALRPEADVKKQSKNSKTRKKIAEGDEEAKLKGSYGMDKAKVNSSNLRGAHHSLGTNGSILVMVKQSRQNVGPTAFLNPKTKSGGLALTYYATCELWFSIKGKLRRAVRGKSLPVGSLLKIQVKKNRQVGLDRSVLVPFYTSVGFDDLGSCVDFLVEWGEWKGSDKRVEAPEFGFSGSTEKLITKIEVEGLQQKLKLLVTDLWEDIEEQCRVERKSRY